MITVSQGRLKTKMQEYFQKAEQTGEEQAFADIRGTVKYYDDLLKPETEEWGELC